MSLYRIVLVWGEHVVQRLLVKHIFKQTPKEWCELDCLLNFNSNFIADTVICYDLHDENMFDVQNMVEIICDAAKE